jgi:hypothetical protein
MATGPGGLYARCVGSDALPQLSHGGTDGRAPGAVDDPGDSALVGRRRALQASELADGILSSSGAQT